MQPFGNTPPRTPTPTPPPSPTPSSEGRDISPMETGTLNGQGVTVQPNTERTSPLPSTGNEPNFTIIYSRTNQPTPEPEITGSSVEKREPVTENSADMSFGNTPPRTPTPTPPPSPTPSSEGRDNSPMETGTFNGQGFTTQPNTERTSPLPSTGNEPNFTIIYSRTNPPTPEPEITGSSVEKREPVTENSAEEFEPTAPSSSEKAPYQQLLSGGTSIGTTILNSQRLRDNELIASILNPPEHSVIKWLLNAAQFSITDFKSTILNSIKVSEQTVNSVYAIDDNSDIARMLNQAADALKTSFNAVQNFKANNETPFRPPVIFTDTRESLSPTNGDTVWDRAEGELKAFVQGNYTDHSTHLTPAQFFEKMKKQKVDPVLVHQLTGPSNHNQKTQRTVVVIPSEHGFILAGRVMDKEQHRNPISQTAGVMETLHLFNIFTGQQMNLPQAVGQLETMLGQYQAAVFPTLKELYQSELFGRLMAQYDENHKVEMKIDAVYSPADKAMEVLRGLRGISTPQMPVQQPPLAAHPVEAIAQPETDDGSSSGTSEKVTEQMTTTSMEDEPTDQSHMIGVGKGIVEQSFVLSSDQAKLCLKGKEAMVRAHLTSKEDSEPTPGLTTTQIKLLNIQRKNQLSKALNELKSSASSESGLDEKLAVKRYLESIPEQTRTRDAGLTLAVLKDKEDEAKNS